MNAQERQQLKDFSKELREFCSKYRATARSGGTIRRPMPVSYKPWDYEKDFYNTYLHTYEVPAVELEMSEDDLKQMLNDLAELNTSEYSEYCRMKKALGDHFLLDLHVYKSQQAKEQRARQESPGVQKAWENYQLMLKLAGGSYGR